MSKAYYNEFDKKTAAWLRELIKQGLIADGIVDDRSIIDVQANDLRGFTQCHFFAGIGVWSYSLRQAGWSDDRPVWTGSCPCQPFSVAGKGKGTDDDRHLWPVLRELVAQHEPPVFFGEQVASKDGRSWLNTVRLEMEALGYGVGAADLCAAGVGAPHIRQREWFVAERVAHSGSEGPQKQWRGWEKPALFSETSGADRVADVHSIGFGKRGDGGPTSGSNGISRNSSTVRLGITESIDSGPGLRRSKSPERGWLITRNDGGLVDQSIAGPTNGFWKNPDWLFCRDGKWRPVESGTSPLVNGASNRVVKLRGYGNAIVSEVAQEFIAAYMEC